MSGKSKALHWEQNPFYHDFDKKKEFVIYTPKDVELRVIPNSVTCGFSVANRSPLEFDLIHAYAWGVQLPSILEFFKAYCREDAHLLVQSNAWPKPINGITIEEDFGVVRKPIGKNGHLEQEGFRLYGRKQE